MPSEGSGEARAQGTNLNEAASLEPAPLGAVFGFMFPFNGTATSAHPGIIISSRVGTRAGREVNGVIALAITHSAQSSSWKEKKAVLIPDEEKTAMGLDNRDQWVCLFEQVVAYFPDDIETIRAANGPHLGQASEGFTRKIRQAWSDYRTR